MDKPAPAAQSHSRSWWWVVGVFLAGLWLVSFVRPGSGPTEVDYTTALTWIRAHDVKEATLEDTTLTGTLRGPQLDHGREVTEFRTTTPRDERLVPLLDEYGTTIRAETAHPSVIWQLVVSLLPWVLIIGVSLYLSRRAQAMMPGGGAGPFGGFLQRGKRLNRAERPLATFGDVAGLGPAKRDLAEMVTYLREPARFLALGAKIPRGVLLVGPPGTGKTLLARAVAGEAGVPFFSINGSQFVEMFVGVGAARVRDLFAEAKKAGPSIIFIDELDAVGRSRSSGVAGTHEEREQTLDELLVQMDGFERDDLTVIIAATNRPDVLDAALLRPGRFDRRVLVDLPEAEARRGILAVHTRGKPLTAGVDLAHVAAVTAGFSGADLENLANEAALAASRREGTTIEQRDFDAAYDKIVLGDPRETKLGDGEKRRVAVHESGHALVAWLTPDVEPPHRVSILPRGMALGATHQLAGEDRHLHTRAELAARLRVLLAGQAAERLVLRDISTGAANDLKEAMKLATNMVAHFGMSEELGPIYSDAQDGHRIEREAAKLVVAAQAEAASVIQAERELLDRLVTALLDRETIERDDIAALLGVRPGTLERAG